MRHILMFRFARDPLSRSLSNGAGSVAVIGTLARIKWYDAAILAVEVLALVPKKERSRFFRWLTHTKPESEAVCKNCGNPPHEEVETEEPPKKKRRRKRKK